MRSNSNVKNLIGIYQENLENKGIEMSIKIIERLGNVILVIRNKEQKLTIAKKNLAFIQEELIWTLNYLEMPI